VSAWVGHAGQRDESEDEERAEERSDHPNPASSSYWHITCPDP
jgi:hypothetical protein